MPAKEELGDDHAYLHHQSLKANASMIMMLVIVALTLLFEECHHTMMHKLQHFHPGLVGIVNNLFRELTVLGFIGLSLFILIYVGWAQILNDRFLGQTEVEEIGKVELAEEGESPHFAPTQFAEMIERVHIFIFVTMFTYILYGFFVVRVALKQQSKWKKIDEMPFVNLRSALASPQWSDNLCRYWITKMRFLYRNSPFGPRSRFPESFKFYKYLGDKFIDTIAMLVKISLSTWMCLLSLILLSWPLAQLPPHYLPLILLAFSCFLKFVSISLMFRMRHAIRQLHPPLPQVRKCIISSLSEDACRVALPLNAPIDNKDFVRKRNAFVSLLEGSKICNVHESLLPFGAKGVTFVPRLIQFITFLLVALVAHSTIALSDSILLNKSIQHQALVLVPMILALICLTIVWPNTIANFVIVSNVGLLTDVQEVAKLDGEFLARQHTKRHAIVEQLRSIAATNQSNEANPSKDLSHIFSSLPLATRENIVQCYSLAHQVDVSGVLHLPQALEGCLAAPNEMDFVDRLMKLAFDQTSQRDRTDERQKEAKFLFKILDADKDGLITSDDMDVVRGANWPTAADLRMLLFEVDSFSGLALSEENFTRFWLHVDA